MFSDDLGLTFGVEKCAKVSVTRGKVNLSGNVTLSPTIDICELNSGEVYKYLGFLRLKVLTVGTVKSKYWPFTLSDCH